MFLQWISTYGAVALFGLLLLGVFGLPVPDETLLTFAGVLVHRGHLTFATTWIAATLGSMCGITISYVLGRRLGPAAVARFGRWFHVRQSDLDRVEQWMERSGKWSLTFGYFVPGVRHVTALVAGSSQLPQRVFAIYAYSGAALWSLAFITLGRVVGNRWEAALSVMHRRIAIVIAVIVVAALASALFHLRQRARDDGMKR